ncbi:MAG TPA: hypothetical protein VLI71_09850 [Gammaproteobacteria bacterium]|nr:hypothetical protein [Gammaproteobacteria bacterium]
MLPEREVPLTPIAPPCSHYEGNGWRTRCGVKATRWVIAPDGLPAPGSYFCDEHATAVVAELSKLGDGTWTARPLVFPCSHSRDPRLCAQCRPHKFVPQGTPDEKHRPAGAGDFGCLRCGAWTTYRLSFEEANEKLGPCPEWRCRYGLEHAAPCGPTPDPMYCACGCSGDDFWCGSEART